MGTKTILMVFKLFNVYHLLMTNVRKMLQYYLALLNNTNLNWGWRSTLISL